MNHGNGSVVGQVVLVEYNRLTVSETVSIDEPGSGYMEMLEYRNSAGRQKCNGRLFGNDDARHHPEAESIRDSGIV